MRITDVERFVIPIEGNYEAAPGSSKGTTVEELIIALKRLPLRGIIERTGSLGGDIVVYYNKPDIDTSVPDERVEYLGPYYPML